MGLHERELFQGEAGVEKGNVLGALVSMLKMLCACTNVEKRSAEICDQREN